MACLLRDLVSLGRKAKLKARQLCISTLSVKGTIRRKADLRTGTRRDLVRQPGGVLGQDFCLQRRSVQFVQYSATDKEQDCRSPCPAVDEKIPDRAYDFGKTFSEFTTIR